MTSTFWYPTAILIGLALAFVLIPVFFNRPRDRAEDDLRNQNLLAYRSRMAELESEYERGLLDEDNYRQLRDELAGSMLDDVPPEPENLAGADLRVDRSRTSTRLVALACVVLVPLAAVFLYQQYGALDQVRQYEEIRQMAADSGDRAQQMASLAGRLRERLEENPDNVEGWAMLGRTYMNLERYPDAAWTFERLAGQLEDAPDEAATAWGLAAQARFFEAEGEMTDAVTGTIDEALSRNPDEVNALGLMGINAFENEDYERAIEHWQRIVTAAPDHPQLASIQRGIEQAYQRLGREPPEMETAEPPDQGAISERGVTVRVELDEAFAGTVSDDTTLFIYAREPETNTAPLAVVRRPAGELPLKIRLDDSMAMSAASRISGADQVTLAARISRGGTPTPQPGDLQGVRDEPAIVDNGDGESEPVTLRIDQQVR